MSENKFIKHLKGEDTAKSVLEIKNQRTTTSFANMPAGTSNANDVYSDNRGNATGVLRGSDNWKLSGLGTLIDASTVYGDGRDFIDSYDVLADSLWVDATYTFSASKIFNPNTKFVLKLCGERLSNTEDTVPFSLIITIGNSIITKSFVVREHAFTFSEEFVIDFAESNTTTLKCAPGATMRVQLLCGAPNASATLYYGMTVFTALQRRVDADVVASDEKTFEEVVQDIIDINDDIDQIHEDIDDLEEYVDDTFVKKAGDTMSGALNIAKNVSSNNPLLTLANSDEATRKWNFAPRYNTVALSVYPGSTETNGYRFATTGFVPASDDARYLGSASLKWKSVYTYSLNNGAELLVPNKSGTLATMGDVELAARSGRMLTDQGVWYAKMYSATVVPTGAQYDGTNYADFSQVDNDNNPIIVIYEGQSGAWVLSETITPPTEYDGYVPITSKIWDIVEQAGQQGGRILWNHQSKEFTPYPQIISFEDIEVTGNSTVVMPYNPSANQIVNKNYVDGAIAAATPTVNNPTIIITQGGITKGSFSLNQANGDTIALDATTLDIAQSIDADIVGTLTINGSIVSGFSNSNYLILPGTFHLGGSDVSSFEIECSFTTPADMSNPFYVLDGRVRLLMSNGPQVLTLVISETGNFQTITGITTLTASTKYYVKIEYDGTEYKLYLSTDGSTYNLEATATTTVVPEDSSSYKISPFTNAITSTDMSDWFIKRNGQIIWQGMDAPGLHQRASNKHEVVEFQPPTTANNYTWYRKYADGWVEMGGKVSEIANNSNVVVTLPVEMANNHYTVTMSQYSANIPDAFYSNQGAILTRTTTTITLTNRRLVGTGTRTIDIMWEVKGMYAQ